MKSQIIHFGVKKIINYFNVIKITPHSAHSMDTILSLEIFSLRKINDSIIINITEVWPMILATGGFSILA